MFIPRSIAKPNVFKNLSHTTGLELVGVWRARSARIRIFELDPECFRFRPTFFFRAIEVLYLMDELVHGFCDGIP